MIEIHQDAVPLVVWEDGSIRFRDSRLLLYLVIEDWQRGLSPERIHKNLYTTVQVADIYAAIGYYCRHKDELDAYFKKQDEEAEKVRKEYEARPEYQAQRQRLLALKAEKERRDEEARRRRKLPKGDSSGAGSARSEN